MDSDLASSSPAVAAARLATSGRHGADQRAVAACLASWPGSDGPFIGRAVLGGRGIDRDLGRALVAMDPQVLSTWPRRDLTFALLQVIRTLAGGTDGLRRSGVPVIAAVATRRPIEVMRALAAVIDATPGPNTGLAALLRALRRPDPLGIDHGRRTG